MKRLLGLIAGTAVVVGLMSGGADAAERRGSVADVVAIEDGRGTGRILFRPSPEIDSLSGVAVSEASLTLTVTGSPREESLALRVFPLTASWNPLSVRWDSWQAPGGDYDPELYAAADLNLRQGGGTVRFDVTAIMKEYLEDGAYSDGLVITVRPTDGNGLLVADIARFGDLRDAVLELKYRKVRPRR